MIANLALEVFAALENTHTSSKIQMRGLSVGSFFGILPALCWYNPYKIEQIRKQIGFYLLVQRGVTIHRRRQVHFQQIGIEDIVYQDVEAKELEAVVSVGHVLLELSEHHLLY